MAKPGKTPNQAREKKGLGGAVRRDNIARQDASFSAYQLGKKMGKRHAASKKASSYSD